MLIFLHKHFKLYKCSLTVCKNPCKLTKICMLIFLHKHFKLYKCLLTVCSGYKDQIMWIRRVLARTVSDREEEGTARILLSHVCKAIPGPVFIKKL